jgi:hypothetical protein
LKDFLGRGEGFSVREAVEDSAPASGDWGTEVVPGAVWEFELKYGLRWSAGAGAGVRAGAAGALDTDVVPRRFVEGAIVVVVGDVTGICGDEMAAAGAEETAGLSRWLSISEFSSVEVCQRSSFQNWKL